MQLLSDDFWRLEERKPSVESGQSEGKKFT